jgi:long-chain acyl-CoA synthetase
MFKKFVLKKMLGSKLKDAGVSDDQLDMILELVEKNPDFFKKLKYQIADKLIFSKVKNTIGIENANLLPTAGARLSDEIAIFMKSIGVPITYGYGLTESTATVTCYDYTGFEVGTVGSIMPDVSVKIGEDNEILLKGKTIFPGYYKNKEFIDFI